MPRCRSDLWRIRCKPLDDGSGCESHWGANLILGEERLQYGTPADYGGGMLWLKLDNFRLQDGETTEEETHTLVKPSGRSSPALTFYTDGDPESPMRRLFLFGGYNGAGGPWPSDLL